MIRKSVHRIVTASCQRSTPTVALDKRAARWYPSRTASCRLCKSSSWTSLGSHLGAKVIEEIGGSLRSQSYRVGHTGESSTSDCCQFLPACCMDAVRRGFLAFRMNISVIVMRLGSTVWRTTLHSVGLSSGVQGRNVAELARNQGTRSPVLGPRIPCQNPRFLGIRLGGSTNLPKPFVPNLLTVLSYAPEEKKGHSGRARQHDCTQNIS